MIRVKRNSSNPIQGDEVPCQRPTHSADMNRPGRSRMAEIRQTQIAKVEHEQEEGEPEMRAREEVHEAEQKQVVGDEVATEVCGGSDVVGVAHVERVGVAELQNEDYQHVDGGEDAGLRKGCRVVVVPELV